MVVLKLLGKLNNWGTTRRGRKEEETDKTIKRDDKV
jgi:hypothetical protein